MLLLEESNIEGLAESVEKAWRKCRPRLMRLYDETEQVKARSLEAARRCRSTSDHLQQMGVLPDQADSLAMYEWVYLPDIDEAEEVAVVETLQTSTD